MLKFDKALNTKYKVIGFRGNTMATSPEGKRLSTSSSKLCESCHVNPAIKYCAECPVHLCDICTRGHRNLKYTKDHVLSDIGASSTTPVPPTATPQGCHKHSNKKFTTCCTECVQLICDSCKNDHKGHELILLTSDAKLHQKVCSKNIQNLLGDLQEIDGMKTILESNVTTYEDAIREVDKWELDLFQMVKTKAAKLRQKLKGLKDKKYKQLSDKVKGLIVQLQTVDQSITKLNSIRKSIDTQMLENELSSSQDLIEKLERYKTELQPLPLTSKVENVLPNGDMMKEVDDVLNGLFTDGDIDKEPYKGPTPVAAWKFSASNGGKDISQYGENPVKLTNIQYGPGPKGEQNGSVILPKAHDQSIMVENPTNRLKFADEMTLLIHVFLEGITMGALLVVGGRGILWVHPDATSLHVESTGPYCTARQVITQGSWHKIAVVWDVPKSNISIFVNDKLVKSENGTVDLSYLKKGTMILGPLPNDKRFVQGRMASVKMFNLALTLEQIQKL